MDIRTLAVVLGVTHVVQLVVFAFLAFVVRAYRGAGWWLLYAAAEIAGFSFILLRAIRPIERLSIIGQNALIVLGTVFLYVGITRFLGRKERRALLVPALAAYLLVLAWFTFGRDDLNARSVAFCLALAGTSLLSAHALLAHTLPSIRAAARLCGGLFVAHGLLFLYRAAVYLSRPPVVGMFAPTPFNVLQYFDGIVVGLLWTFGLTVMVNQRLHAEVKEARDRFALLFDTSPDAVLITRLSDGLCREVNAGFTAVTGFERSEVVGALVPRLGIWESLEDRRKVVEALVETGSCHNVELALRRKGGERWSGILSARTVVLDGVPHMLSVVREITDRVRQEEDLRRNRRFLSDLIELSGALVCVKDRDGRYELVNRKWEETTGLPRSEAIGRTDEELFPGPVGQEFRANDRVVLETGRPLEREERLEDASGTRTFLSVKFPVRDDDGTVRGLCGMITEITDRKRAEEQARYLANHDGLTGLPTLRLATDRLGMALGLSRREASLTGVMFVDLDGFKAVNDTFGHDVGDLVLRQVAERLRSCVRETDTVARIGGDEFLAIATNLREPGDAGRIAGNLVAALARPIPADGHEAQIGASVGVALYPGDGDEPNELVKRADEAMYRVKSAGKNGFAFAREDGGTGRDG